MPSPRVLVDLSVAPLGGAGTYAEGFARGLVEGDIADRDQIVVLVDEAWASSHRQVVSELRGVRVTVDELSVAAPGSWAARLQRGVVTRRAVRRHHVEVAYFPRDVAPAVPVASVILANNLYAWKRYDSSAAIGGALPAYLLRLLARRSARKASAVLAVSVPMADAVDDDIPITAIVHHGCALAEAPMPARPPESEVCVVAMVGNVMANKGMDRVIEAVAIAEKRSPSWELRIYGGRGDEEHAALLEREGQASLGYAPLRGPVSGPELHDVYREADVVVMGTTFESFCFPLVEAMRSGCAVVAPAGPLVDEICGDVAVTFDDGDIASLSAALERARDELLDRRVRGVERARRFSWPRTAEQTIALVRGVVGSAEPATRLR